MNLSKLIEADVFSDAGNHRLLKKIEITKDKQDVTWTVASVEETRPVRNEIILVSVIDHKNIEKVNAPAQKKKKVEEKSTLVCRAIAFDTQKSSLFYYSSKGESRRKRTFKLSTQIIKGRHSSINVTESYDKT